MGTWLFVLRSLRHHARNHLGVVLGAAVAATVLVGALLVGDSVRASLRAQALLRLGGVDAALIAHDRFFTTALGDALATDLPEAEIAPVLQLAGIASVDGGARRANGVQVLGVDERFFRLAPTPTGHTPPERGEALVNERLARQLDLVPGADLLLRVEQPSALPRDVVMATTDDTSLGVRVKVAAVLSDEELGSFGLRAAQIPPYSAFLSLDVLQREVELEGRANLLLTGAGGEDTAALAERADRALGERWTLADAQLAEHTPEGRGEARELLSDRVFLDAPVDAALAGAAEPLLGVLTYFVNAIELGERSTPYSMVAGVGTPGGGPPPADAFAGWDAVLPADPAADGILLNEWCADDLAASVGDRVTLHYFVVGPDQEMVEESHELTVRGIVPIAGVADDPALMPRFPGLADADHCREWEPGVFVDLDRIRDKDELYWDDHRGTPKAFVSLSTARELWSSRFGSLTAVRTESGSTSAGALLRGRLDPASVGLFFQDVRGPALAASAPSVDFGSLFLGLSFFLIAAAVLLTALLFAFGVEQRAAEIGTLYAVGLAPTRVRGLFLREAAVLALVGAGAGALLGTLYTRAVLRGLGGLWSGAVGSAEIAYHARPATLAVGVAATVATALLAIVWTLRGTLRRTTPELLATSGGVQGPQRTAEAGRAARGLRAAIIALAAAAGGALLLLTTDPSGGPAAAGSFFGAGALFLIGALAATRALLARLARPAAEGSRSVAGLGARNAVRRPGRSLATVALLAAGVFLVVAVQANRLTPVRDAAERGAGTGGFRFFGSSTLAVLHDLNTPDGRDAFALDDEDLEGVSIVGLRVRDGDDASCLNLGSPARPRLVGVAPAKLAERGAFSFARVDELPGADELASPWSLLDADLGGPIPAIGDQASVQWTMKKGLGETLDYVDERGARFEVQIVATLADSILQGDLLVAEDALKRRFPSESGQRLFLVDAPAERADDVAQALGRGLRDVGLELTPTAERLEAFHAVQNTYLAIFQVLGGLGLLLGSAGLAVVVLRNALERRAELAALRALGFAPRAVRWLVLSEHGLLLALGLVCGTLPALAAVLPLRGTQQGGTPLATILAFVGAIAAVGLLWAWLATLLATRGGVTAALRND
ncbi:MAG: FtsX-like permease family protein [Planctomycetota bacterium]